METLRFIFTEDENFGTNGLVLEKDKGVFNTFTEYNMFLHDVLEHWFEGEHKYFRNQNAYNMAGELVAMGILFHLSETFSYQERYYQKYYNYSAIETTVTDILLEAGYTETFGRKLLCPVPKINKVSLVDEIGRKGYNKFLEFLSKEEDSNFLPGFKKHHKENIKLQNVIYLLRYGEKLGQRLYPWSIDNNDTILKLIEDSKKIMKVVKSEESSIDYINVKIQIGKNLRYSINVKTWDLEYKFRSDKSDFWRG